MSKFLDYLIVGFVILIFSLFMGKTKPNAIYGVRTTATLSNPDVWRKTNKLGSVIFAILSSAFILLITFYKLIEASERYFDFTGILFFISIIASTVYLSFYAQKILKDKERKLDTSIINNSIKLSLIFSLVLIILGIILPFTSPNSFVGIRIGKTISNPLIWKKVNAISGIGFVVISLLFSYIFYKDKERIKGDEAESIFVKHLILFTISLVLWSLISILFSRFLKI